jgi:diaminohydroxyphosphoribosylaminopyrimidine deaminase/5-amino-6-(5-phosphoribosylamino)uracil reductase
VAEFTAIDYELMSRALRLARRGRYSAHPNPRVGCVVVADGAIVGEGWHRRTGEAHAEIHALEQAGRSARGATVYVTLEPCSHHGRTPPCADALVEAGVARVIAAMEDPNPKVAGAGFRRLSEAGIAVRQGLLQELAEALNEGFISRVRRGRPFVRFKVAASLDGATAMASGESRWITGAEARADVQKLRAASGAVMTGVGTVVDDDPSLTVRDDRLDTAGTQPLRVVLDTALRTPVDAQILRQDGETLVFCLDDRRRGPLERAGATVVVADAEDGRVALPAVLADLAARGVSDLLVEAGPTLGGALLAANLVDELVIYQAPHIMGSETRGMVTTPGWHTLGDRLSLDVIGIRRIGRDIRLIARPSS